MGRSMTDKLPKLTDCPVCGGCLWVCEDHPDEPWEHDGCGGAGAACVCNPQREVAWGQVYAEVPPGDEPLH
jgi:hypothetical protein